MADYYTTNAYSRNANSNSNSSMNSNNGYYSSSYNSNSNNDMYSNPYGATGTGTNNNPQPQQQQQYSNNDSSSSSIPVPSLWNPVMTAAINSVTTNPNSSSHNKEAMMQLGLQVGHRFLDEGTARLIPGLETFMKTLRVYFAVDNNYVKRKMMRVLFSFVWKNWNRLPSSQPSPTSSNQPSSPRLSSISSHYYALPIHDDNAPDLYIPFMSLITYVLLCALCYGTAGQFDPDVLLNVTSKCMITQLLEVCLFKVGIYMIMSNTNDNRSGSGSATDMNQLQQQQQQQQSNVIPFLDLFAFTGYKYLALTCNMIIGYTLSVMLTKNSTTTTTADIGASGYGQKGYYIMFLWTASSISYFILKTMSNNLPKIQPTNYYQQQMHEKNNSNKKRELMILIFALSQFVTLWFLGQTKFLN